MKDIKVNEDNMEKLVTWSEEEEKKKKITESTEEDIKLELFME